VIHDWLRSITTGNGTVTINTGNIDKILCQQTMADISTKQ
jgi:hypothetical protein